MKPYLFALGAGLLVGVIYSLLNVRSPAPPVVALVGLLGILIGEQVPPFAGGTMCANRGDRRRCHVGKTVEAAGVR
jgi:XapX domain-containing protein